MMRMTFILGTILAAISTLWYVFAPNIISCGSAFVSFKVTASDELSQAPLANATVELVLRRKDELLFTSDPSCLRKPMATAKTDQSGIVEMGCLCGIESSLGFFGRTERVDYSDLWLLVTAQGYSPNHLPISQFTGEKASIRRRRQTDINVKLTPVKNGT